MLAHKRLYFHDEFYEFLDKFKANARFCVKCKILRLLSYCKILFVQKKLKGKVLFQYQKNEVHIFLSTQLSKQKSMTKTLD